MLDEGADELEDDDDEYLTLIDKSIHFHRLSSPPKFVWSDESDNGPVVYEFHIDATSINTHTLDFFETTVLECMFERQFKRGRDTATHADLEAFRYDPTKVALLGKLIADEMEDVMETTSNQLKNLTVGTLKKQKESTASVKPLLVVNKVDWYYYDVQSQQFMLQRPDVTISLLELDGNFNFGMSITDINGEAVISQPLDDQLNPVFSDQHHSFIWVYQDSSQNQIFSFSVVFKNQPDETEFRQIFGRCLYETSNKDAFSKIGKEDVQYIMQAYNDVEMTDAFDKEELREKSEEEEEEEEEEQVDENYRQSAEGNFGERGTKNSALAVGYKVQRSFVARGDRIGVFKHDENDQLMHSTTINKLRTSDGKTFSPAKMMMHNQDSSMIMLDPNMRNRLYKMDLEYGKVVDEWEVDGDRAVNDITQDSKYAQMTAQDTFVGISHNALFRIDPRQSGKKIVDSQTNQYKSENQFSCTTTTGKGDIIVASETGDLRLYDKIDKRAKTHLPGLGDAINGVDVSEDGHYILATCKKYILVIDTVANTDKGQVSGFNKSMGAKKPAPKRLQLKPEHVAEINMPINFTTARFNTGTDSMEKTIVASTGPYVITWNFREVKNGQLFKYVIKKYPQHVIADSFRYGSDKNVIVALPNDVTMLTKRELMTPKKAFASPSRTPARNLRQREAIVDSPY